MAKTSNVLCYFAVVLTSYMHFKGFVFCHNFKVTYRFYAGFRQTMQICFLPPIHSPIPLWKWWCSCPWLPLSLMGSWDNGLASSIFKMTTSNVFVWKGIWCMWLVNCQVKRNIIGWVVANGFKHWFVCCVSRDSGMSVCVWVCVCVCACFGKWEANKRSVSFSDSVAAYGQMYTHALDL